VDAVADDLEKTVFMDSGFRRNDEEEQWTSR